MDTLSRLFGTEIRVKMMRLFLFNPEGVFDLEYLIGKTSVKMKEMEKELGFLKKLGLVRQTKLVKTVIERKRRKTYERKKKVKAWALDKKFEFVDSLTDFLVKTHSLEHRAIVKKIERAGKIKAVLVSGVFTRNPEARLDMFVVGDNINPSSMERIVRSLESEMGKDIRYAVLSAPDFSYRMSMNDKLVRDVLDFPHRVLLDKIGLSIQ